MCKKVFVIFVVVFFFMPNNFSAPHVNAQTRLYATQPVWSPNDKQIAFVSQSQDNTVSTVDVYDIATGKISQISPITIFASDPAWSPDGKRIAFAGFSDVQHPPQIFTIGADGENLKQLTTEGNNEGPLWSPDGKFIVFNTNRDFKATPAEIWSMNTDGSDQKLFIEAAEVFQWLDTGPLVFYSYIPLPDFNTTLGMFEYKSSSYSFLGDSYSIRISPKETSTVEETETCPQGNPPCGDVDNFVTFKVANTNNAESLEIFSIEVGGGTAPKNFSWSHDGTRVLYDKESHIYMVAPVKNAIPKPLF